MATDGYQTCHGDHFIKYANVKPVYRTPETNIILQSTIFQLKKKRHTQKHNMCEFGRNCAGRQNLKNLKRVQANKHVVLLSLEEYFIF